MRSEATLQHPGHGEIAATGTATASPAVVATVDDGAGHGNPPRCIPAPDAPRYARWKMADPYRKANWRDIRSPSSAGFSKYHHQTEKTMSTAPTITATRPADTPCDELAVVQGHRHRGDALAEHDEGEEPVALGDVAGVPRVPPAPPARPRGAPPAPPPPGRRRPTGPDRAGRDSHATQPIWRTVMHTG